MTLLLGVVGSVIGGTIANVIGTGSIFELNIVGFIAAVVVSVAALAMRFWVPSMRRSHSPQRTWPRMTWSGRLVRSGTMRFATNSPRPSGRSRPRSGRYALEEEVRYLIARR